MWISWKIIMLWNIQCIMKENHGFNICIGFGLIVLFLLMCMCSISLLIKNILWYNIMIVILKISLCCLKIQDVSLLRLII